MEYYLMLASKIALVWSGVLFLVKVLTMMKIVNYENNIVFQLAGKLTFTGQLSSIAVVGYMYWIYAASKKMLEPELFQLLTIIVGVLIGLSIIACIGATKLYAQGYLRMKK